jgi:uncharacterized membrane protein HdeD (DUF308 family)
MKKEKKKLDELTQAKLIYSIELGVFALIFLVLGILLITHIIGMTPTRITVFTYVTLVGGFIGIGDFVWVLLSKKRRKKNSLLDKALVLPLAIFLIVIDILTLATGRKEELYYCYVLGSVFSYIAIIYTFEAIYHWFKPIPMILEGEDKIKDAEKKDAASATTEAPVAPETPTPAAPTAEPEKTEQHDK